MKKYKQLTSEQRYAIYLGLENGDTQRTIASLIGVSPSAVSRELQRNKDKRGGYSWRLAHEMAMERRERLPGNRSTPEWIKQKVIRLVRKDWSPGQISGHLRKKENIRVSHETIYKWIREDKKAGGDLYKHCRHRLKHRKRPVGSVRGIPNRRSIRERPVEADGKRFGDFEMDTMIGADQSEAILTVTERKTNLVMIGELPRGRDSKGLAYSYNDRYFTEFNFGYNGSENFKKGYRFGFFPSVALGWVISNESFMQGMNPWLSFLKLRGSYGLVGNDNLGGRRFAYVSTVNWTGGYQWGYQGDYWRDGLVEGDFGIPDLTWETATKANVGAEIGLFSKFMLQVDLFKEHRKDIFIKRNPDGSIDPFLSFQDLFLTSGETNKEIIFSRRSVEAENYLRYVIPRGAGGWGSFGATQNLVDAFLMRNGLPITDPQSGYVEEGFVSEPIYYNTRYNLSDENATEGLVVAPGVYNMYANREPRFYISIRFNNQWIHKERRNTEFYNGGRDGRPNMHSPICGYQPRKYVNPNDDARSGYFPFRPAILYRLGEFYLNYAEALIESNPSHPDILKYLNRIRQRAGIPDLPASLLGNQEELRKAVRRERRVELAFETNLRQMDIRRWLIGEEVFAEPIVGMDQWAGPENYYRRTEITKRFFHKKMYLWPIPQGIIDNNSNIIQNKFW
jgi:transposase